jgi:hypothetical protein
MPSLFSQTGIENDARNAASMLRYAFANAKNRHTVTACDKHRSSGNNRFSFSAVNPHSRMLWGEAVWNEISRYFCDDPDEPDHNQRLYFVTLIDLKCVTKVDAQDVSIAYIIRRLRLGLRGLNYLAVIEPAFYVNMQAGVRFNGKRCLCWHLHAVVWGVSKKEIKERMRLLNRSGQYVALVPGRKGAQSKRVRQGTLPVVVGYMFKPPVNGYRVTRYDRERDGQPVFNEDGEVQAKFLQGKGELRPGQHIKLFHVMKGLSLDQLTVAGGQGVPLLARAKRQIQNRIVKPFIRQQSSPVYRRRLIRSKHSNRTCK